MKTLAHLSEHTGSQAESRRFARDRDAHPKYPKLRPPLPSTAIATLLSPRSFAVQHPSLGLLPSSAESLRPTHSA
jgi:hypothetical protein